MYGLQIKNKRGQILVDSEFEHFHFAGKATLKDLSFVPVITSGNNTNHSDRNGDGSASSQLPGPIWKYILYANAASDSPAPMCFIKPDATGGTAPRCGVILTQRSGPNWIIWVSQTYGGSSPVLYCFLPLRHMATAKAWPVGDDAFSLATYSSIGRRTYDARIRPLKVIATGSINSPAIARAGGKANGVDPVFTPDTSVTSNFDAAGANVNDLIFYCPSLAHSCQEHKLDRSGDGFQFQGFGSYFYSWAKTDFWWCFYRSTFRIVNNTTLESGYDIYAAGHVWKAQEDSTSILGILAVIALSFVTFGAAAALISGVVAGAIAASFTNAGVASGTYYPYKNSSRNADSANAFLISRASYYD